MKVRGFTLIELLVVITIISTLAVTVFVALNPAQRIRDAKDARRITDVDTILTAIHAAVIDNKGNYPFNVPAVGVEAFLGTGGATCNTAYNLKGCNVLATTACVNLMAGSPNLTRYLKDMPVDPNSTLWSSGKTGYSVLVDSNGIVTVRACGAEGSTNIHSSR